MGDRALAHVERVVTSYGVEKADRVEMTQVLDFHVVAKKGEFKAGDLVVYVEVDSILPDGLDPALQAQYDVLKKAMKKATGEDLIRIQKEMEEITSKNTKPEFEFLRQKKFRIKALKYNSIGVISQGIVFPISILPADIVPEVGMDVTQALGIVKVVEDEDEVNTEEQTVVNKKGAIEKFLDHRFMRYSIYRSIKSQVKGTDRTGKWEPWMASKTDEENIQKLYSRMFELYGTEPVWAVTSKIEGQSMSAYNHIIPLWFGLTSRSDFAVCSRSRHLIRDDGSRFWQTARELDLEKRLKAIKLNIMLSGEHAGGKIQGNIYKLPEHHWYVFRVFDIATQKRYTHEQMLEFCHKYEFEHVPVVSSKMGMFDSVQKMLDFSNGTDELVKGVTVAREGVVWQHLHNPDVTFKIRSPEYLVLHGK